LAELENRTLEMEARLDATKFALQRLSSFVSVRGNELQCPRCWILNEAIASEPRIKIALSALFAEASSVYELIAPEKASRRFLSNPAELAMNLKLVLVVTLIAARPLVAFAQKDDPVDHVPKLSIQDAQKVAQTISNDKIKLQAYCEIGKLQEELEKAEEKNETKAIDALGAKIDNLQQQVGPEYARIMDGLEQVDPNSSEGQKFAAVFNPLHEKCK
jgi:hypothetical protein